MLMYILIKYLLLFLPQVLATMNHSNYLYRVTALHAAASLAPNLPKDILNNKVLVAVVNCGKDRVPNVRFNTAKVLEKLAGMVEAPTLDSRIKPCLTELAADQDMDVRFFAEKALVACEGITAMK